MSAVISEADLLPRKFISDGFVEIYQMGKQAKPLSFEHNSICEHMYLSGPD